MKLGLYFKKIDISIYKINKFYLNIFKVAIKDYLVKNKLKKI